ncbi:hypothetical protein BT69DRAFT_1337228 [Atractiella rhizophila]|nr:hypothetical protein BT69DRAFT_1337228 [Atractiella rhizophila]
MELLPFPPPVALFVLGVTFLLLSILFRRRNASPDTRSGAKAVVLFGPTNAGKTALFCKLVYGSAPDCVTSTKENEGTIVFEKSKEEVEADPNETRIEEAGEVVDLPGHPRLRARQLARHLPHASGIVFVVDGSAGLGGKAIREAGECLHILISLLRTLSNPQPLPLFIYVSKSDLSPSQSPTLTISRFRSSLERELERRRLSNVGGIHSTGTTGVGAKLEGLEDISLARNQSLVSSIKKFFLGGTVEVQKGNLPEDENEILANEDLAFEEEGEFEFRKLKELVDISWGVGSTKNDDVDADLRGWIKSV